jgi:hypothetical protein
MKQVLDKKEVNWHEQDLVRELADVLHKKGMRKFMDKGLKK